MPPFPPMLSKDSLYDWLTGIEPGFYALRVTLDSDVAVAIEGSQVGQVGTKVMTIYAKLHESA